MAPLCDETWRRCGRIGLALTVVLLAASSVAAEPPPKHPPLRGSNGLGMYAEIGKGPFQPTDKVPITVHLVNVGKTPLIVNARLLFGPAVGPGELTFKMLGPDNRARYFEAKVSAADESDTWRELAPGTSLSATWNLVRSHDLEQEGIYAVQVAYDNRQDPPAGAKHKAWKGRLVSRIHHFRRQGARGK